MANVSHATLTDPNLHEPKGVAAASADSIYQANGSGSGSWKLPIKKYSISITPSSVTAQLTAEQTFTCSGLASATDTIIGVSGPAPTAGTGIVGWRCSADNTVAITFTNPTAGNLTPAAGTYIVFAHRA